MSILSFPDRRSLIQDWITALRSGQYTQGREVLRQSDVEIGPTTHCCLGVLCELVIAQGLIPDAKWDEDQFVAPNPKYDGGEYDEDERQIMPTCGENAELPSSVGRLLPEIAIVQETLIDMNDQLKQNFEVIATYIEEEILITIPEAI